MGPLVWWEGKAYVGVLGGLDLKVTKDQWVFLVQLAIRDFKVRRANEDSEDRLAKWVLMDHLAKKAKMEIPECAGFEECREAAGSMDQMETLVPMAKLVNKDLEAIW